MGARRRRGRERRHRAGALIAVLLFALALAAAGCGAGADSQGGGSTGVDSAEADPVERLLLEFASGPGFDPDLGTVEFVDCRPLEDVEYEGHPAFYCEFGNDATIADKDPFELVYPLEKVAKVLTGERLFV